ncbi:hypothetical protein BGX20_006726, partial [Mortierella sp. AD010]
MFPRLAVTSILGSSGVWKRKANPVAILQQYLSNSQVVRKNKNHETFGASMNVFVHRMQTPLAPKATRNDALTPEQVTNSTNIVAKYDDLRQRFQSLCDLYNSEKAPPQSNGPQKSMKPEVKVLPSVRSRGFNKFETVDRPSSEGTTSYRRRYSVKHRSRKEEHDVPETMKQYTWKPWKKVPEIPVAPISNETEEPVEPEDPEDKIEAPKKDLQIMEKVDLVHSMRYEHPVVTLNVGTVVVNVEEALSENGEVNTQDCDQVVNCLKDI